MTFEDWWRINHPHDWLAEENSGCPVNTYSRLRIAELAKNSYRAGLIHAAEQDEKESKEMDYGTDFRIYLDSAAMHRKAAEEL